MQETAKQSGHCPNCQAKRNMRVSEYDREEITQDGDILKIKTTSFHCEICNEFIDGNDVIANRVRRADSDRRNRSDTEDEKSIYKGLERRSGKERRIWVDRMREIVTKISVNKDTK